MALVINLSYLSSALNNDTSRWAPCQLDIEQRPDLGIIAVAETYLRVQRKQRHHEELQWGDPLRRDRAFATASPSKGIPHSIKSPEP